MSIAINKTYTSNLVEINCAGRENKSFYGEKDSYSDISVDIN